MNTRKMTRTPSQGFTLIELLTVIAIIGVLAAILFPVVGKVRESAGEAAIRAQFSQWSQAMELFRQEYGYYPDFGTSGNDLYVNQAGNAENPSYDGDRFYETLTGRTANDNERLESGYDGFTAGNIKSQSFYSFSESEVEFDGNTVIIRDSSGNGDIVVLFDRNQDGVIKLTGTDSDYEIGVGSLPDVRSARTEEVFSPTADDFPNTGVRAGVIFYSPGHGKRLLMSWK